MEQLINNMLANTQLPQMTPSVKKGDSAQKDGFQKLLEQKQTDGTQAPRPEKTDAPQSPRRLRTLKRPRRPERPSRPPPLPRTARSWRTRWSWRRCR